MENNKNEGGFSYTYSAKEQAELKKIREKYSPEKIEKENKIDRIRRLDRSVTNKAQTVSLIIGVVGTLILGFGMSLIMTDLSDILGAYKDIAMFVGIPIGLIGGVMTCLAYPIYNLVYNREKKKKAPEILRLTEELIK